MAERTFDIQGITITAKGPDAFGRVDFRITLPNGESKIGTTSQGANNALNALRSLAGPDEQAALNAAANFLATQAADIEAEILAEARAADKAAVDQGPGTASAGQSLEQEQLANDDRADVQAPQPAPQVLAPDGRITDVVNDVPTNAAGTQSDPTTGTNDPTRNINNTNSIPPPTSGPTVPPGSPSNNFTTAPDNSPNPTVQRGIAADNDDNTNSTVSRINTIFGGNNAVIRPTSNVLDQYSSYTYTLSLYLLSPQEFANLRETGIPSNSSNLLLQSGGAQLGQRNQEMPLDFYIDNLRLTTLPQGKSTGGANSATELSFDIIEPSGVTFLERLAQATRQHVKNNGQLSQTNNYAAQMYALGIKFYGYDSNGELVRVSGSVDSSGSTEQPGVLVQKFIPFRFKGISFRLSGRLATYSCTAVAVKDYAPPSQTRGIIPYNIELTSISLKELLGVNLAFAGRTNNSEADRGQFSDPEIPGVTIPGSSAARESARPVATSSAVSTAGAIASRNLGGALLSPVSTPSEAVEPVLPPSQSSAPPKASAAPRTLVRGLTAALNEIQAELVRNGTYQYPDVYEIILNENILREATLQPSEAGAGLRSVPMTAAQTAGAQKLGIKQAVNRDSKNVSAVAGMSIVQFLDQVVRNSSYIFDQQIKEYKKDSLGKWITQPRSTGATAFAWYRIGMDAVPIKNQYDEKRGDYAYRISYSITPYQINENRSGWFPGSKFNGTHKKYEYWFTGLNTQIIDYEQKYDFLYYITTNGGQLTPVTSDYREYSQYAFQARAPEASQGASGPLFDPSALAASSLYSPGDTSQIRLNIMGDPAWIQQGEILTGIKEYDETFYGAFLPDGTINYDSRQILFEVTFNTAGDYDINTGLMDVQRKSS